MVKDIWDSFKDNIKERVSNPFLGTFALVWVVHNWQIVYAFFYFDSDWKLKNKIAYFSKYWTDNSFIWNLVCVAFITVGVLVITYLFLAVSRFLANYFENVIIPQISKWSKGKIVTEETYQIAIDKIQSLEAKVEAERKAKNEAMNERDEFEKRLYPSDVINIDSISSNNFDFNNIISLANSSFDKNIFSHTILNISKEKAFNDDNQVIEFLLKQGFIELVRKASIVGGVNYYYKFTDLGNEFKSKYFKAFPND